MSFIKAADVVGTTAQAKNVLQNIAGYGYDKLNDAVVSYMRSVIGARLQKAASYKINGRRVYHSDIVNAFRNSTPKAPAVAKKSFASAVNAPATGSLWPQPAQQGNSFASAVAKGVTTAQQANKLAAAFPASKYPQYPAEVLRTALSYRFIAYSAGNILKTYSGYNKTVEEVLDVLGPVAPGDLRILNVDTEKVTKLKQVPTVSYSL